MRKYEASSHQAYYNNFKQTDTKKWRWITEMIWNNKRINKNRCNGSKLSNNWAHSSAHYAKNYTRFPLCAHKNKHFETFIGWILGQSEITCEIREHTTTTIKCIRVLLCNKAVKNWNSEISTEMRLLRKRLEIFAFVNATVRAVTSENSMITNHTHGYIYFDFLQDFFPNFWSQCNDIRSDMR